MTLIDYLYALAHDLPELFPALEVPSLASGQVGAALLALLLLVWLAGLLWRL